MGITVNFDPPSLNCGVTSPGGTTTASTSSGVLSAPVNVTASIADDTSGGALMLLSLTSFINETEIVVPGPGDLPRSTSRTP